MASPSICHCTEFCLVAVERVHILPILLHIESLMLAIELNIEILDGTVSSICDYEIAKLCKNIPQVDMPKA